MRGRLASVVGQGLAKSASGRVNFWVMVVGVVGALVFQSWWVLSLTAAAYAALMAWDLGHARFWKRVLVDGRRRPPRLPEAPCVTDSTAQRYLQRLSRGRADREQLVSTIPARFEETVGVVQESVVELEQRAITLIWRADFLGRYLADKRLAGVRLDAHRLERASCDSEDEQVRAEYAGACQVRVDAAATLQQILDARELTIAKLESVLGTLELFAFRLMRLCILDVDMPALVGEDRWDPSVLEAETQRMEDLAGSSTPGSSTPAGPVMREADA